MRFSNCPESDGNILGSGSTHVKEIPNTKLLVSLHYGYYQNSANMEIFDISKKGKANKIYSLGEVSGSEFG
jgi:hypothetical protein